MMRIHIDDLQEYVRVIQNLKKEINFDSRSVAGGSSLLSFVTCSSM